MLRLRKRPRSQHQQHESEIHEQQLLQQTQSHHNHATFVKQQQKELHDETEVTTMIFDDDLDVVVASHLPPTPVCISECSSTFSNVSCIPDVIEHQQQRKISSIETIHDENNTTTILLLQSDDNDNNVRQQRQHDDESTTYATNTIRSNFLASLLYKLLDIAFHHVFITACILIFNILSYVSTTLQCSVRQLFRLYQQDACSRATIFIETILFKYYDFVVNVYNTNVLRRKKKKQRRKRSYNYNSPFEPYTFIRMPFRSSFIHYTSTAVVLTTSTPKFRDAAANSIMILQQQQQHRRLFGKMLKKRKR